MAFGNEIKQSNITENWLFDFANDNSGYLRFALSDVTESGNFYRGVILNNPSVRESIDLASSTSKTSNMSITIPDFSYQGSPISKELFGGSNHYLNQTVSVYSVVGAGSKQQVGSFRLSDISSDGDKINLQLSVQRPWDFIYFPQSKSTNGIYTPIVYGTYTGNASDGFCLSTDLFPVPQDMFSSISSYYLAPRTLDNASGNETQLHFYEKGLDKFIPINDDSTSTQSVNNGYYVWMPTEMERTFKFRPTATIEGYDSNWDNPDNGWDTSVTSYTEYAKSGSSPVADSNKLVEYEIPEVTGIATAISLTITGRSEIITLSNPPGERVQLYLKSYGGTNLIFDQQDAVGSDTSSAFNDTGVLANYQARGNTLDKIIIESQMQFNSGGGGTYSGRNRVSDVYYTATMDLNDPDSTASNRSTSLRKFLEGKNMYMGCDGLSHGITGASGTITEIHEAHLDLLNRFAGVDVATNPATNIDGWSDLDSDKDWGVRYWKLEEASLKKELEKLQYEGGFVFRYKSDGSPQYIHIKDSYSSTDATLSKNDLSGVTVKPTPLSELLTKMDISYEKNPAENRYFTEVSPYSHTSRTNWNIQAKENISKANLDAYVSPAITAYDNSTLAENANPNDDFFSYYHNIFGDIKMIVSASVVNPKYYNLEVGSVIDFSDMYPETPYGYNSASWANIKFMITNLNRSPGELKITAREIA